MLLDTDVNYWAVFLAAVAYYLLGALWYMPQLFGREGNQEQNSAVAYLGEMIVSLIMSYVLAIIIYTSHAFEIQEGMKVAALVWLGFIGTTQFSGVLWGRKSIKTFFVNAGFMFVGLLLAGLVISSLSYW
jgi:hypothetical protein